MLFSLRDGGACRRCTPLHSLGQQQKQQQQQQQQPQLLRRRRRREGMLGIICGLVLALQARVDGFQIGQSSLGNSAFNTGTRTAHHTDSSSSSSSSTSSSAGVNRRRGYVRGRGGVLLSRMTTSSSPSDAVVASTAAGVATEEEQEETPALAAGESGEGKDLSLADALELGVNKALRGDISVLEQVMAPQCTWKGPLSDSGSRDAVATELDGLGAFFEDPRLTILPQDTSAQGSEGRLPTPGNGLKVDWMASGTWPLPWRPRLIVRGTSNIDVQDGKITAITDAWESNLLANIVHHTAFGFWDVWHQFCSPIAEKIPYDVVRKGSGYEVRRYPPRLILQASIVDRTNDRERAMARFFPHFVFGKDLTTRGKKPDLWMSTTGIEVEIEPFLEENDILERKPVRGKPLISALQAKEEKDAGLTDKDLVPEGVIRKQVNKITWSVLVPTMFGLKADLLPPLVNAKNKDLFKDEGDELTLTEQGYRTVAVAKFNGHPQDVEATPIRKQLYESVLKDGYRVASTEGGRPRFGYRQMDSHGGWNLLGNFCIAVWEFRPKILGLGNEVFFELEGTEGRG